MKPLAQESTIIFGTNKCLEHLKNLFKSAQSENLDSGPRYPPFPVIKSFILVN